MKIPVIIVSGFLGAGKTTFIQHILKNYPNLNRIMIIENDFGQVNFDADMLGSTGVQLKELTSGCICCSLVGDFKTSLSEAISLAKDIDLILIEPSGVGKLSDILHACQSPELQEYLEIHAACTIVDITKAQLYIANFGEFYKDQVAHATHLILSHTDNQNHTNEELDAIHSLLQELNPHAKYITKNWDDLDMLSILSASRQHEHNHNHEHEHSHNHEHEHSHNHEHVHDTHHSCGCTHHNCDCEHHHEHEADEMFETITLEATESQQTFTHNQWKSLLQAIIDSDSIHILRIKGILPSATGYIAIQYNGNNIAITDSPVSGKTLTVIGSNLNRESIITLWK